MDLSQFAQAALILASPSVWLWLIVGTALGMVFGAAPGLTATAGIAIATPLTFGFDFASSMALLLGLYCSGYFAGSIPAILINMPGAPGNAATSLDGHALARRGKADLALCLAVIGSAMGGFLSILVLAFAAPTLSSFALRFTSVEYAVFGMFGLTCIAAISRGSLVSGLLGAVLGMVLGLVGIDPVGGMERLTFGNFSLLTGIALLPALIAFFAITEVFAQAMAGQHGQELPRQEQAAPLAVFGLVLRRWWLVLKSGAIGIGIGLLPGTGPTIASWIAYGEAARGDPKVGSKDGSESGVLASEVANNAVTGAALVPLLTLGIPGDTVTAILIGAFLIQGIEVGPLFIATHGQLFMQILILLALANLAILVVGLGTRRWLPLLLRIPQRILVPLIVVFCAAGAFSVNNMSFDVLMILVLGFGGFVLMRLGMPMAPVVLGLVLGPIVERNLRDALTVHQMDWSVFVTRPISLAILCITLLVIGVTYWRSRSRSRPAT
ncbi:tripartite tricarboxylate transporter permease [Tianweitania sediminis]|nr:tripartite tricarboxylate transporter permease [Tianweitania sediminis]